MGDYLLEMQESKDKSTSLLNSFIKIYYIIYIIIMVLYLIN